MRTFHTPPSLSSPIAGVDLRPAPAPAPARRLRCAPRAAAAVAGHARRRHGVDPARHRARAAVARRQGARSSGARPARALRRGGLARRDGRLRQLCRVRRLCARVHGHRPALPPAPGIAGGAAPRGGCCRLPRLVARRRGHRALGRPRRLGCVCARALQPSAAPFMRLTALLSLLQARARTQPAPGPPSPGARPAAPRAAAGARAARPRLAAPPRPRLPSVRFTCVITSRPSGAPCHTRLSPPRVQPTARRTSSSRSSSRCPRTASRPCSALTRSSLRRSSAWPCRCACAWTS